MAPIRNRDKGLPTKHKGIRKLGKNRYLLRKKWVDPRTGRTRQKHQVFEGTLEDAVAARARLRPEPSEGRPTRPRFGQYATQWLKTHSKARKLEPSTRGRYEGDLANLVVDFGEWWLDAITYKDLLEWQVRVSEEFAAPTVNGWLRTMRLIFEAAMSEGVVSQNPARKLPALPERRTKGARGRSLSIAHLRAFITSAERLGALGAELDDERRDAWARGKHGPRGYGDGLAPEMVRMVTVLLWTGARIGEVVALRWEDVLEGELAIERSVWRGNEKATKTDDPRRVPLVAPLNDTLQEQRRWLMETQHPGFGSGLVFPSRPQQAKAGQSRRKVEEISWYRSQSGPRDAITKICTHAQVPRITPHALRRTFEDLLREAGVDDLVRRAMAGWRTDRAQGIYATVRREDRDLAASKVIELVFPTGS